MAVLRLSFLHHRDEQRKKPGTQDRKPCGLSLILDAFRCRAVNKSSVSGEGDSKARPSLKLSQIFLLQQEDKRQRAVGSASASASQEVSEQSEPDANKLVVVGGDKALNLQGDESEVNRQLRGLVESVESGQREDVRVRAAMEVRRISHSSGQNRLVLAELGVIPLLVELLTSMLPCSSSCKQPLLALLNLAIGNNRNKQWIVEAGAVPVLVRILSSARSSSDLIDGAAAALLSLSALDSNKPVIGDSGAVEQLVRLVRISSSSTRDCIRVLYNLSISSANCERMVADGVPGALLNFFNAKSDGLMADRILATLGNLAELSEDVRKCATTPCAIAKLLAALTSYTATMETSSATEYASRCQERVLYLLMLLTHKSWSARQVMASAGAVTPLLEVALLGSPISQRRAGRILDYLREERFQRNVARPMSAPLSRQPCSKITPMPTNSNSAVCEQRRAVDWMVKQSLEKNMEKMVHRAKLRSEDLDSGNRMRMALHSTVPRYCLSPDQRPYTKIL